MDAAPEPPKERPSSGTPLRGQPRIESESAYFDNRLHFFLPDWRDGSLVGLYALDEVPIRDRPERFRRVHELCFSRRSSAAHATSARAKLIHSAVNSLWREPSALCIRAPGMRGVSTAPPLGRSSTMGLLLDRPQVVPVCSAAGDTAWQITLDPSRPEWHRPCKTPPSMSSRNRLTILRQRLCQGEVT